MKQIICNMFVFCGFVLVMVLNSATATPVKTFLIKDTVGDDILIETVPSLKLFKSDSHKYYYIGTTGQVIWFQALLFCKSNNMELVSIETKEEEEFLWRNVRKIFPNNNGYWFWTSGVINPQPAGHFAWAGTGQPMTFTNWAAGEPNSIAGRGCVAALLKTGQPVLWHNAACAQGGLAYPICETSLPQTLANAITNHNSCNLTLINVEGN